MVCAGILGLCFNTIVYIESLSNRGQWFDSHRSGDLYFTGATQEYAVTMPNSAGLWSKWILRDSRDGKAMLESVRYHNHYLDAHHSYNVKLTHSYYPYNKSWTKWTITKEGNAYYFESVRYPNRYIENYYSWWYGNYGYLRSGKSGQTVKMRVYQPQFSETEKLIISVDNTHGTTAVNRTIVRTTGISKTVGTTTSISAELNIAAEIKSILTIGGSLSATWQHSSSTTWSSQTTDTLKISVAPGSHKRVWQAVAYYGIDDHARGPYYRVCSDHLRFEGWAVNLQDMLTFLQEKKISIKEQFISYCWTLFISIAYLVHAWLDNVFDLYVTKDRYKILTENLGEICSMPLVQKYLPCLLTLVHYRLPILCIEVWNIF